MDKQCADCKEIKNDSEFGKRSQKKDGLSAYCKSCLVLRSKAYREKNIEKVKQSNKEYSEKNKESLKEKNKEWRARNKEKRQEYSREYNLKNKERRKEWFNDWKQKNPERLKELKKKSAEKNRLIERERKLKKFYNMSLEEFNLLSERQNHKCTICKKDAALEKNKNLVVDHCHRTGKVRSLLCDRCNRTMGSLEENIEILESMIKYIREYETKFSFERTEESYGQDLTPTDAGVKSQKPLDENRECLTVSSNGAQDGD